MANVTMEAKHADTLQGRVRSSDIPLARLVWADPWALALLDSMTFPFSESFFSQHWKGNF
jgi:hypothetical protein